LIEIRVESLLSMQKVELEAAGRGSSVCILCDTVSSKYRNDARDIHILNDEYMGNRAIVISHLLSDDECDAVMQFINSHETPSGSATKSSDDPSTMIPANSRKEYRNCLRMCATSELIAAELLARITPILASLGEEIIQCTEANSKNFLQDGLGMLGQWNLDSINTYFRLCKYHFGGHFAPHFDSDFIVDPMDHRSLKTLMIYLNGDYDGGETQFCNDHALFFDCTKNLYCAPDEMVHTRWKPSKGDCILFDHRLLHEGSMVSSGEKYIMRSEVMYKKQQSDGSVASIQEQAIRLWYEGCDLEAKGDIDEAIKRYRRAYKLYPELENQFF